MKPRNAKTGAGALFFAFLAFWMTKGLIANQNMEQMILWLIGSGGLILLMHLASIRFRQVSNLAEKRSFLTGC